MKRNNFFIIPARLTYLVYFAILFCCASPPVYSAYPQPTSGKRVYDFASLLSSEQETQLEQLTAGVAGATTAELDIVTVSSLHGETIEEYANNLFNEWAIGRADTNNGVLFLIAPNERRVRIEVGYGLEPLLTDGLCGSIIAQNIIPAFKAGRFDEGIIGGAERIAGILRQHPEQAQGVKDSAPKFLQEAKGVNNVDEGGVSGTEKTAGTLEQHLGPSKMLLSKFVYLYPLVLGAFLLIILVSEKHPFFFVIVAVIATFFLVFLWYINLKALFSTGVSENFISFVVRDGANVMWFFLGSLFVLLLAIGNIVKYIRFLPPRYKESPRCKKCRKPMIRMTREEKKGMLDDGEQKEEELGSVRYEIWQCRSCNSHIKKRAFISYQYEECPKCKYRTVKKTIVKFATTSSTGLTRMQCTYACRYEYEEVIPKYKEVIPKVSSYFDSSSGDSSSSGWAGGDYSGGSSGGSSGDSSGGSSGGGGASGGW